MKRLSVHALDAKCDGDTCNRKKLGECQICGIYVCGMCCQTGTPVSTGAFVCNPCFWR